METTAKRKLEMSLAPLDRAPLGVIPRMPFFILSFCIATFFGCSRPSLDEQRFHLAVVKQSENPGNLNISNITPFNWDLICVAFPYEGSIEMQRRIGIRDISIPPDKEWKGSEDLFRFVFFNKNGFVNSIRMKTSEFYLAPVKNNLKHNHNFCFNQTEMTIVVSRSNTQPFVVIEISKN